MKQPLRSVATHARRLALLAALASASCWAGAAEITLAAITTSPAASDGQVQDLGRIQAVREYDADVRRELVRHARHPDLGSPSPRQLNGKVDVAFDVANDGSVMDVAIAQSSRSNALDGAALRSVGRSRFQPLPAGAQVEGPRRYIVTFDYRY